MSLGRTHAATHSTLRALTRSRHWLWSASCGALHRVDADWLKITSHQEEPCIGACVSQADRSPNRSRRSLAPDPRLPAVVRSLLRCLRPTPTQPLTGPSPLRGTPNSFLRRRLHGTLYTAKRFSGRVTNSAGRRMRDVGYNPSLSRVEIATSIPQARASSFEASPSDLSPQRHLAPSTTPTFNALTNTRGLVARPSCTLRYPRITVEAILQLPRSLADCLGAPKLPLRSRFPVPENLHVGTRTANCERAKSSDPSHLRYIAL